MKIIDMLGDNIQNMVKMIVIASLWIGCTMMIAFVTGDWVLQRLDFRFGFAVPLTLLPASIYIIYHDLK